MDEFDLDFEEALEADERLTVAQKKSDKLICSCGHAISRHRFNPEDNKHECRPNAYRCPCLVPTPVLEVSNTRYFMKKNQGSGAKHALSMGYAASKEALGDEFTDAASWLIPATCQFCGAETKYYPVRTTRTGVVLLTTEEDQGVTAFLCQICRDPRTQEA